MTEPPGIPLLLALRATPKTCMAFAGAGGKTSAMFELARELVQNFGRTALVTTTTHLAVEQSGMADAVCHSIEDLAQVDPDLAQVVLVAGSVKSDGRLGAPSSQTMANLRRYAAEKRLPLLVEADGSRMLPLKAPAEHEPAIPEFVEHVVVVAGLQGLGHALDTSRVHRVNRFAALSGINPGDTITPEALAHVLSHPDGGLKNIPHEAERSLLLNQADTATLQAAAGSMAKHLLGAYDRVIIASLQNQRSETGGRSAVHAVHEPIAGIILSAGGGTRFGGPKQLLPWRGEALVRHVSRTALLSGLHPVFVVAGEQHVEVRDMLADLPVQVIHNPNWIAGQSTSLQAGLRALPEHTGGTVFLLADQPQIPSALVSALVEAHAARLSPIVGPLVDGRRGNPVLFDRRTYADLMALTGDTGGKPLFAKWRVEWLPWHDAAPLMDVDTPEDYTHLQELE